ncbi:MFS transporter [Streptomyces noursei]|uniref:MFS transporter n=1 Tax=Streptomyces noursei TaxID=1971 RepID=UPI0016725B0B|nr:MFS transporter [Streptomyces noursei]MCZ1021380.1 MFS transporter [Streptomyces noursei]GGX54358.1 MFS transporter [Streptomyces noursei]
MSTSGRGVMRVSLMRTTDAVATSITTIALPLLILSTTGSSTLTGMAFVLEWLPRLLAFSIGGYLIDRYGADRVFRSATAARATVLAAAAGVLCDLPDTGTTVTAVVMALGALSGLLSQVSFVAIETFGLYTSRASGDQAHRVQIAIDQGALLSGPVMAALLLMAGPEVMLLVTAALSTVAACSAESHTDAASPLGVSRSFAVSPRLRAGRSTMRGLPALGWLVSGLMASNLALAATQANSPTAVLHDLGGSPLTVGVVWSAAGVACLAAVAASRRAIDRLGLWLVGATGAAMAGSACLAAGLAPGLEAYAGTISVLMVGESTLTLVLHTLRARLVPARAYGSVLSATTVLLVLPLPVAGVLVTALPALALPALLLACAVLQGLAMTAAVRGLWRHRASYAPAQPVVYIAPTAVALPVPRH